MRNLKRSLVSKFYNAMLTITRYLLIFFYYVLQDKLTYIEGNCLTFNRSNDTAILGKPSHNKVSFHNATTAVFTPKEGGAWNIKRSLLLTSSLQLKFLSGFFSTPAAQGESATTPGFYCCFFFNLLAVSAYTKYSRA